MNYNEIMKLPYIIFVLGMIDAPQLDYENKEKVNVPKTKEEEISAFNKLFK